MKTTLLTLLVLGTSGCVFNFNAGKAVNLEYAQIGEISRVTVRPLEGGKVYMEVPDDPADPRAIFTYDPNYVEPTK